ncbi:MAG: efflux RND transporter periplasmic adaptor subunit, partial [Dehalococcoidia bacterium]
QANIALKDATLTSPFDGVVSLLPIKMGQIVSPAVPAVTVLVPGTLVLELNVGETELPSIRSGETGSVLFDALPGQLFPIQVYAVGLSPATEQGIIIYTVRCTITGDMSDASQPRPSPGMSGTATIVTQEKPNVVAVPSAAIRSSAGANVVAVMDADGKVAMRPVQTGLSDGDNVEVVSGLSVGDKIGLRTLATPTPASDTQDIPGHIQ